MGLNTKKIKKILKDKKALNFGRVFGERGLVLLLFTVCLVGAGVFLLSQKFTPLDAYYLMGFGIGPNNQGSQIAQAKEEKEKDEVSFEKLQTKFDQATKIKAKYQIDGVSLKRTAKDDPKDRIEVVIGNKDDLEFSPELKIARWDDEVNLIVKPKALEGIKTKDKDLKFEGDKIKFETPKVDYLFYDLGEKEIKEKGQINKATEWSYEQEIVLKEKPINNVIEFVVEIIGLEYRSHNGGYEFFRKLNPPEGILEEEEMKGFEETAFYLDPIVIKDAKGRELRNTVELTNSSLKIIIYKEDLYKAVYPVSIDPSYTVQSGVVYNFATAYNNGRRLARTSNGDLHCVWTDKRSTYYQIYYAKSTNGGETWTETAITSEIYSQYNPSIAIDSNNYIHIAWYGKHSGSITYNQIRYIKYTTSWQAIENLTSGDYHQYIPSIAIDSNNYIHIAWHGYHSGSTAYTQIRYIKYITSWQAIENLTSASDHQQYPGLIWAPNPTISGLKTNRPKNGYAFVWTDCTGTNSVMFYKSADLSWDTVFSTTFLVGGTESGTKDTALTTITFPQGSPEATISAPYNDIDTSDDPQVLSLTASEPVAHIKNTHASADYNVVLEITTWTNSVVNMEYYNLAADDAVNINAVTAELSNANGAARTVSTGISITHGTYKDLYLKLTLSSSAGKTGTSTLTILGEAI